MNVHVLKAIAAVLESDETLTKSDKQAILGVCYEPRKFLKPPEGALPRLFTVKDVTAALQISRTLLWRLTKNGILPQVTVFRTLRFRREDIEELIWKATVREEPTRPKRHGSFFM